MNEHVLTIIKAMARGELAPEPYGTTPYSCLHCGTKTWFYYDEIEHVLMPHKVDCAITLARQYLRENNTPVNIYKATREWSDMITYETGFTSQEVVLTYEKRLQPLIHVEFLKELKILIETEKVVIDG